MEVIWDREISLILLARVFQKGVLGTRFVDEYGSFPLRALMGRGGRGNWALFDGGINIIDTKAEVMQARTIFGDPILKRMVFGHRLNELQVGVSEVEVRQFNRAVVDDFRTDDGKPELVSPKFERLFGIRNGYGNVIESLVIHVAFD